jgi:hypothetical protein
VVFFLSNSTELPSDKGTLQLMVFGCSKNSLFVDNARGRRTATILASTTSSCRRHNVDPQLYLTQLLINLPALSISQLPQWLPDQWKIVHTARMATLQNPAPHTE